MKPWEIWSYQPAGWPEPHPAVIISGAGRVANKPEVNILMCTSKRATRSAEANEVTLDTADGLDWPTLCKCDLVHLAPKATLTKRRGRVSEERRRLIIATINRSNDWFH